MATDRNQSEVEKTHQGERASRLSTASAKPKQDFPDCAFCAPCRCDDECGCAGAVCWACSHWYDKESGKVFVVLERADSAPSDAERTALKELRKKVERGPWITLYDCQDCGQLLTSTLYQIHNADHTVITLNYIDRMAMLAEIDAQERAGAKAASEETA